MSNAQYVEKADRLAEETRLSEREAELYVLKQHEDYTIRAAAKRMEISPGNAFSKWDTIKQKIEEAQRTAELDFA